MQTGAAGGTALMFGFYLLACAASMACQPGNIESEGVESSSTRGDGGGAVDGGGDGTMDESSDGSTGPHDETSSEDSSSGHAGAPDCSTAMNMLADIRISGDWPGDRPRPTVAAYDAQPTCQGPAAPVIQLFATHEDLVTHTRRPLYGINFREYERGQPLHGLQPAELTTYGADRPPTRIEVEVPTPFPGDYFATWPSLGARIQLNIDGTDVELDFSASACQQVRTGTIPPCRASALDR